MTSRNVSFIDLKQRFQEEKKELMACVERVLEKGNLVMTPELDEFEQEITKYTGAKYAIGLNSGTDALMMGLMTAGVKRGDEVITSPLSFVATSGAIAHIGATPVYVDTGNDMNINADLIEASITKKTTAIVPVHWAGRIAEMDKIMAIAEKYGLAVIEDSAQTMGAYYNDIHGGTFGLSGAISFHPLKNLNAVGDGGMLLTNSKEVFDKVRLYRNHGLESRDNCVEYGVNSRLDILNAEILKIRLKKLDDIILRRKANVDLYRELITAPEVIIPKDSSAQNSSYVMFLTLCKNRDELKSFLNDNGVECLVYYGTPLHMHKAAEKFGYKKGALPVAELQASEVLALPHHQHLSKDDIVYVSEKINEFYSN